MTEDEPTYNVVWPLGPKATVAADLAARPATLEGKVVAELWDYLFKGDKAFPILRQQLQQRFPGIEFIEYPFFGSIHGPDELDVVAGLPEMLRATKADAVIAAVGH
jgi:hypothetical protein